MMLTITMKPVPEHLRNLYGLLYESVETIEPTGRGVHNSGFRHLVQVWPAGRIRLQPQPVAIATKPMRRPLHLGEVAIGSEVTLVGLPGGPAVYRVDGQLLDNPVLTPVGRRAKK